MPDISRAPPRRILRNIIGGSAGNLVEWFDWYVYAAFALYFAHAFFPKGEPTAQLLQTAAIFAVGFIMRPLGAWLMGIYADHRGRKAGLTLSVTLMCVGSLSSSCADLCAGRTAFAAILLIAHHPGAQPRRRIGSSATHMSEMADRARRGFWSSFLYVTIIGGQLAALALLRRPAGDARRECHAGLGLEDRLLCWRSAGDRRVLHPPRSRRNVEL